MALSGVKGHQTEKTRHKISTKEIFGKAQPQIAGRHVIVLHADCKAPISLQSRVRPQFHFHAKHRSTEKITPAILPTRSFHHDIFRFHPSQRSAFAIVEEVCEVGELLRRGDEVEVVGFGL